jgi:hypothetical protein
VSSTSARERLPDAIAALDPRSRANRLKCYLALARWDAECEPSTTPPPRELPEKAALLARAGVPLTTFNDHFERRRHVRLHDALGVPRREGVDRCVLEAKEFTVRPWLRGWNEQVRLGKLSAAVAAESLIRVVAGWSLEHRHLAAMNHLELPPVVSQAVRQVTGRGEPESLDALLEVVVAHVVDDPGATSVAALNAVRSRLRDLSFTPSNLRRRSLELSAAIGNFMLLVEGDNDHEVDPQLVRSLSLALDELTGPAGETS